ncbi:hypothetical protein CDL60_23455 [Roseateles noduli]|nr:hypothetical protein CDL60_23455 [Roseateles noduli]
MLPPPLPPRTYASASNESTGQTDSPQERDEIFSDVSEFSRRSTRDLNKPPPLPARKPGAGRQFDLPAASMSRPGSLVANEAALAKSSRPVSPEAIAAAERMGAARKRLASVINELIRELATHRRWRLRRRDRPYGRQAAAQAYAVALNSEAFKRAILSLSFAARYTHPGTEVNEAFVVRQASGLVHDALSALTPRQQAVFDRHCGDPELLKEALSKASPVETTSSTTSKARDQIHQSILSWRHRA